jgi:hypothetical protein
MHCHIINPIQGRRQDTHSMKHQTERPSEQVMRFFKPELYMQFNSPDDREADEAQSDWEEAIHNYQKHLDTIREQLPSQVQKLADLSLHDAELRAMAESLEPFFPSPGAPPWPLWSAVAILSLKHGDNILSLIYFLADRIRKHPLPDWPFSKVRLHWLYDEIDVVSDRGFLHRVLLSDGTVVEIPFVSAVVHSLPLEASDKETIARQSA